MEMQKTAALENLTLNQFSQLLEMMKFLLDAGKISREEADISTQRIAAEYEIPPIYLW
jgi:hypothetical protein